MWVPSTVQLETIRSSFSISRFTVNTMSGKAARALSHHFCSSPRTSVPTLPGVTRSVT